MKEETLKEFLDDFYNGLTMKELFVKYEKRYFEEESKKLRVSTVSQILGGRADSKKYAEYLERRNQKVIQMHEAGIDKKIIAKETCLGVQTVGWIIRNAHPKEKPEEPLTMLEVMTFKDTVEVGDILNISYAKQIEGVTGLRYKRVHDTVKVLEKYKHLCQTTGGCFRWVDLYLYTRGCA